ncbi:hypothetical protein BPAE_0114g00360 [Botrytis paeoniae]|uniref:Uncharacterized protein n=1 Tax=Botrytis paeoniae TaxID=278948 RepID=A0A4Z1FQY1_9HELO|nr:hypothetical protein BPAE_0114g00360 [Botrytis paeoniae]
MPRRSSERIPIDLPNPYTNTARSVHPSSIPTAASSKSPIPKTTVQVLSNGSERRGGATPTRSEDPEGTVLPNRPVTADLHQLKAVEGSLEASSRNPEGSYQKTSRYSSRETRGEQEEQSEIAKKLGESPEGDSMSNSGNQHELHLRNLSPSTEKISSRNPKDPVRDLYRPSRDPVEKSGESPEGNSLDNSLRNSVGLKTEQQVKTQVHHPRLSITEVTEQRIIGSLPSLGLASPSVSRQPQEEPIRVPRRSLNKALKLDHRLQKFDTNLRTRELPARFFHQTTPPHKQYPSLGIAAAVQRRKAGRNETRRRDGYSDRILPIWEELLSPRFGLMTRIIARRRLTQRNGVGIPEDVSSEFSSYRQYTIPTSLRYSEKQTSALERHDNNQELNLTP